MKIFPVEKIREADAYTIANEPISSIDLMERASKQLFKWIRKHINRKTEIVVFAGLGNNGGDGLALSRLLLPTPDGPVKTETLPLKCCFSWSMPSPVFALTNMML